jgi:hypothetical protein
MSLREEAKPLGEYKDRYVAFLDLLGFKARVESAERNPDDRAKLHQILALVRDTLVGNPRLGLRLTYFSDCLVVTADRTEDGLAEMFQSVFALTTNLLQFDVLVRGGLTAGGAYHERDFVYGTAVTRAHLLEENTAGNPITLISEEVVEDAKRCEERHTRWLCEDGPGRYFVDYLRWFADYRHTPIYPGKAVLDVPAHRIMAFVCRRLRDHTGSVRQKAEWLQSYWNSTVATQGVFERIEPGVTSDDVLGGPTVMYRRIAGGGRPQT